MGRAALSLSPPLMVATAALLPAEALAVTCGEWDAGFTTGPKEDLESLALYYSWDIVPNCEGFEFDHYLFCWKEIEIVLDDGLDTDASECLGNVDTLAYPDGGAVSEILFAHADEGVDCFEPMGIVSADHVN